MDKEQIRMIETNNNIILYQDENGVTRVNVRFSEGELPEYSVVKKSFTTGIQFSCGSW